MKDLDRLDRLVLHELDQDARQSLSQIAKRLKIGSDLVEYRLKRFVSKGMVRRFTPMFVPSALGVGVYKTYLKHCMDKATLSSFLKQLDKHPMLYWMCEGYGTWDLLFSFASRGAVEFHQAQDKILSKYGKYILDVAVYTPIEVVRFPKHYLVGKGSKSTVWQRKNSPSEIDTLERRLLEALSVNCRESVTQLAETLGVTSAVVSYRIKKLEEQGVILGYRTQLDYQIIGMTVFKVFLELRSYLPKLRKEIYEYCKKESRITCFIQQIGNTQIEFEVEIGNYYEFVALIEDFKEQFAEHLGRVEYMLIKEDHFHRIPQTASAA